MESTQNIESIATTRASLPNESNQFSCNECKRRRSKCSREIPVCALCSKHNRHCLYEKHRRTPLTRKHLTEVEEELSLVKRILKKNMPDVELSLLLQGVRNGNDISDIPESNACSIETRYKKRKLKHDGSHENETYESTFGEAGGAYDSPSFCSRETSQTKNSMNIHSILANNDTKDFNVDNLNSYYKTGIKCYRGTIGSKTHMQIPQLLPSSIHSDNNYKEKTDINQMNKLDKTISETPKSSNSFYNWDERNMSKDKEESTIVDGMATTEKNGYLGTSSSAALISLVGCGFSLNERPEKHSSNLQAETTSISNISKNKINDQMLEHYINQYFETYHNSYPIIYKPIFMAQFMDVIPCPEIGWESLVGIVAAIGSFMSATSPDQNDDLALFDNAKSKLSIEILETGNITLVQTLSLMSNYLQKRDRPNSGYNYLGLAVRMALGLGMHKQIENSDESLLSLEIRRRVWWCLYIFDCGQTISYGRPLGVPCAGIDANLPLNIMETDLTIRSSNIPDEKNQATVFTSVKVQSLFHLLTNSIYERIISDPFPTAKDLLEWDQTYLEKWRSLVPHYFEESAHVPMQFKLAQSILEWRYRNLKIIMYRTFLLKRVVFNARVANEDSLGFELRAGEICLQECCATVSSMVNYWKLKTQYNMMDVWYTLFFLIPAVVIPLVCLRNDPTSASAKKWRVDVISAQDIIQKVMPICPSASKISDLIDALGADYLKGQLLDNENTTLPFATSGTAESPMSQLNQLHEMLWPVTFDIEQQFL